jgi:peptidoglycan-associated lipoprotein
MKTFGTIALTLSLLISVGCGGKDKKTDTLPQQKAPVVDNSGPAPTVDEQAGGQGNAQQLALEQIIYFEFDKSDLDDAARDRLNKNAEWMREDAARKLTIEGHTDEVGTPDYNLALGERRARTAKDYLVRLGIAAERIEIVTYGEERPTSGEDALNRRSVFIATKK